MTPPSGKYRITGGKRLSGRVRISGSKNGADYAIAAALLTADDVVLHNVPAIGDVRQMEEILEHLGATIEHLSSSSLRINCAAVNEREVPAPMAARLRASFLVMGPLIARFGRAACPPPGGDAIGIRPLDVHLAGFRKLGADENKRKISLALERAQISELAKRFPSQLSGGQQQRVAIARSLINDPAIILADEPTGNLDSATSEEIMALFQELNDNGKTIILITHEHDIAAHAKRIVHVKDGRILSDELHAQVRVRKS